MEEDGRLARSQPARGQRSLAHTGDSLLRAGPLRNTLGVQALQHSRSSVQLGNILPNSANSAMKTPTTFSNDPKKSLVDELDGSLGDSSRNERVVPTNPQISTNSTSFATNSSANPSTNPMQVFQGDIAANNARSSSLGLLPPPGLTTTRSRTQILQNQGTVREHVLDFEARATSPNPSIAMQGAMASRLSFPSATAGGIGSRFAFLDGVNENTTIHNVPFHKWGTFAGLASSVTFVRDNFVPKVRAAFIRQMRLVVKDRTNVVEWKKFLLLPIVLFTTTDRAELNARLQVLEQEKCHWFKFPLSRFKHRSIRMPEVERSTPFPRSQVDLEIQSPDWSVQHQKVKRYLEHGNLSSAMSCLCSDSNFVVPTERTIEKLQAKHPQPSYAGLTEEQLQALDEAVIEEADQIKVCYQEVRKAVRSGKNLKAPGLDLLRYEHLKQLVGKGIDPAPGSETEFCELLAKIIEMLLAGEIPEQVLPAYRDNVLSALPKGSADDIRPIGMGGLYRKIAGKIAKNASDAFNRKYFGALQDALKEDAIANIVHAFNLHMQKRPGDDVWLIDADNAFNSGNRYLALHEILKNCPSQFPFLRAMYKGKSHGFICGLEDGIRGIESSEGFHQGDVLGTWAYIMTIQPMLVSLMEFIVQECGEDSAALIKFFVDDGNIAAPHDVMLKIMDFILHEGPKYGYNVKRSKGAYLLGKCATPEEAHDRCLNLRERGFGMRTIRVHPDNSILKDADSLYGAKMLGSFIGHPAFIKKQLREYLDQDLNVAAERLKSYPDLQGRWILFSRCFMHKPTHLFRTIPPWIARDVMDAFEKHKKEILLSIMDFEREDPLTETIYSSCNFAVEDGGLGFYMAHEVALAAYTASIVSFCRSDDGKRMRAHEKIIDACDSIHDDMDENELIPCFIRCVGNNMHLIKKAQPTLVCASMQEVLEWTLSQVNSKENGTVQSWFTKIGAQDRMEHIMASMDKTRLKWFVDLKSEEAGLWLRDVPKKGNGLRSDEMRTALRYRLYLPACGLVQPSYCSCKRRPVIDPMGLHLVSGCNTSGYCTEIHNGLANELNNKFRWMGYLAEREERNVFKVKDPSCNMRPDISIHNMPFDQEHHLFDVKVAASLEGVQSGKIKVPKDKDASTHILLAQKSFDEKNRDYRSRSTNSECGFTPIIYMSTGSVHPESRKIIHKLAKKASGTVIHLPARTIYLYTMRACSVALQKGVARAINMRILNMNSRVHTVARRRFEQHSRFA